MERRRRYAAKKEKPIKSIPEKSRPIDPESKGWLDQLTFLERFYDEEERKPEKERKSITDLGLRASEK